MTEFTVTPTASTHSETSAIACNQHKAHGEVRPSAERFNDLVSEFVADAQEIVRRYQPEYEALKAWLTEIGAEGEWRSVLDVVVERVAEEVAGANRRGSLNSVRCVPKAGLAPARMSVRGNGHAPGRVLATVLFTDIVDSTRHAADLGDRDWMELLERHDEITRAQVARFHGRVVRHTGDGIMAIFDGPSRAVRSAATLAECMSDLGLGIRSGLHTGECELRGNEIGGIAVHAGSRIADLARPGEVLVSNTVKDLVNGSGITFQDSGIYVLKGVPGKWRLFSCSEFAFAGISHG